MRKHAQVIHHRHLAAVRVNCRSLLEEIIAGLPAIEIDYVLTEHLHMHNVACVRV